MEKKKIIIGTFVALILIGAACAGTVYYYLFAPQFHPKKTVYIYIDRDDTADSIYNKVEQKLTRKVLENAGDEISWRHGEFIFDDLPLQEIPKIYTPDATPSGRGKTYITYSAVCTADIKNLRISPSAAYAHWTGWHAA